MYPDRDRLAAQVDTEIEPHAFAVSILERGLAVVHRDHLSGIVGMFQFFEGNESGKSQLAVAGSFARGGRGTSPGTQELRDGTVGHLAELLRIVHFAGLTVDYLHVTGDEACQLAADLRPCRLELLVGIHAFQEVVGLLV